MAAVSLALVITAGHDTPSIMSVTSGCALFRLGAYVVLRVVVVAGTTRLGTLVHPPRALQPAVLLCCRHPMIQLSYQLIIVSSQDTCPTPPLRLFLDVCT